jgi:RNA polymerase sigma-70 factor (ECF subfamily)
VTSLVVRPAVVAQRDRRAARREDDAVRGELGWELVARLQGGDQSAATELYRMYADQVLGFLAHRCGDRLLAEDLASEVWLRALRRIDGLVRTPSPPIAWLMTIARNLLADHWKSSPVLRSRPYESPHLALSIEPADVDADPAEFLSRYLDSRKLLAAVLELTDAQRDVLILRFFRQHSVEETATAMGINAGAVKALQYRAVRALARDLNLADFQSEGT